MNILTFDIEDWFHILDNESTRKVSQWSNFESRIYNNTDRILDCLDTYNCKATFFCLGWIAQKYPDIIKKIDSSGYNIESHSFSHQLAYTMTHSEFYEDLNKSIDSIQQITGKKVRAFRAPGFSFTEKNISILEILIKCGIEIDCSIFPTHRAHGGFSTFGSPLPSIIEIGGMKIKEFPLNLYHFGNFKIVFSGGGYFRLLPYFIISYFMKKSSYTISYFHPRDFDPDQPVIPKLPFVRKVKSYIGLRSSFAKFNTLLKEFSFIDLPTADKKVFWSKVKKITIQ